MDCSGSVLGVVELLEAVVFGSEPVLVAADGSEVVATGVVVVGVDDVDAGVAADDGLVVERVTGADVACRGVMVCGVVVPWAVVLVTTVLGTAGVWTAAVDMTARDGA